MTGGLQILSCLSKEKIPPLPDGAMLHHIPLPACQAGHTPPATTLPQATSSPPVPARAAALAEQACNLLKLLVGLAGAQGHVVLLKNNNW